MSKGGFLLTANVAIDGTAVAWKGCTTASLGTALQASFARRVLNKCSRPLCHGLVSVYRTVIITFYLPEYEEDARRG